MMRFLMYTISFVLLCAYGFSLFLYTILDGFRPITVLLLFPVVFLVGLLIAFTKKYQDKRIKQFIFFTWFLLVAITVGMYIPIALMDWK